MLKSAFYFILAILTHQAIGLVRIQDFYPFGPTVNDTDYVLSSARDSNLDDGSSTQLPISTEFKFFGDTYRSLWVNINGAVSFKQAIQEFTSVCQALSENMCMISPFWADVDLRDRTKGKLYYRETRETAVLTKAKRDVSRAFPDLKNIDDIRWAFVVTWYQVPFYPIACNIEPERNTFQMTLVNSDQYTFAIFYYNQIEWTTGTASGGNCTYPKGGLPARAGFDNGLGHYQS